MVSFGFYILYREVQYFLFVYLIFKKNGKAAIQTTSGGAAVLYLL